MSPDHLGTALRDLVDDGDVSATPPVAAALWSGGRRRRHLSRALRLLAAACVAALVGLLVWPTGQPRASVPAVGVDGSGAARLMSYPSVITKPPFVARADRPGVTAAVLTEASDANRTYAVSPTGAVTRLGLPEATLGTPPSLSPDGRWLARGPVLTDLVAGVTIPSLPARDALTSSRMPAEVASWWSPDSRRVYVDAINQGEAKSGGLVVATDGSMAEAPLLSGSRVPVVAGWLDAETVLGFAQVGDGEGTARLEGRTWRVGEPAWEVSDAVIEWPAEGQDAAAFNGLLRAALSPDRRRLLVTVPVTDPATHELSMTQAMMFDPLTGAQVGMPTGDGVVDPEQWAPGSFVGWDGWGCRPAWNDGLPVTTDRATMSTGGPVGEPLLSVSARYDQPCVAFAGDELRGTQVANARAVWQERLWVWGGRAFVLVGPGVFVWWFTRRRSWREGSESPRPFLPLRG